MMIFVLVCVKKNENKIIRDKRGGYKNTKLLRASYALTLGREWA